MSIHEVKIPEIGDAEDVEVIEICVQPGDVVEVDDALIVIESDKASMELPSPVAGTVAVIAVALGDQVNEGDVVLSLELTVDEPVPVGEDASAKREKIEEPQKPSEMPEESAAVPQEPAAVPQEPDVVGEEPGPVPGASPSKATGGRVEVRVPDIGEAKDVVVIEVAVAAGQTVGENDLLVVVESDKASMEIPSPYAGRIEQVAVDEGDEVGEDTLLVVMMTEAATAETALAASDTSGTGASSAEASVRPIPEAPAAPAAPAEIIPAAEAGKDGATVYAGPAVRRLARELGVDLSAVAGSGARGRILKDDVKAYVKSALGGDGGGAGEESGGAIPAVPVIDFARFGATEILPLSRIRARGAQNLHASWLNVVHVTQHDEADVTELERFRKSLAPEAEVRQVKVTPLPFIMKVCQHLLGKHPNLNASLDASVENLVQKRYFNIGFAVDTEEGLVVPVVRDVDEKGIWELAEEITTLSELARTRRLRPDHIQGGCFTISSLGAIGGTGFTPIVNAPEVAILGVARLATKPVWDGAEFRPRSMLPLSLSYDHRAINGAEAGRFMVELCAALGDVRRLIL